jgi:hypothetical protein
MVGTAKNSPYSGHEIVIFRWQSVALALKPTRKVGGAALPIVVVEPFGLSEYSSW